MGYYTNKQRRIKNPGNNRWKWTLVALTSAMSGSALTAALWPALQSHAFSNVTPAATMAEANPMEALQASVQVRVDTGITQAVKRVEPAVMGVVNYSQVSDFFSQQTKLKATGVGTGVLFYKDQQYGYAVTNNHVVEGSAKVDVVLDGGKHSKAIVVGTDPYTDLAVVKVPLNAVKSIQPITFADSNQLQAGEPAIAIGTPMGLDFADSVTAGIVSSTKRIMPVEEPETQQTLDFQSVIQTDAAINPGNSGGPLVNIHGNVIGINSSKIVAQNFEGMGFAIPSNSVRAIATQIIATGHAIHPSLGIEGYSLASLPEQWWPDVPVDYGVWVKSTKTVAAKSGGLQAQDVIVGMDGRDIKSMADLRTDLFQSKPGHVATLRVYRGNKLLSLKVTIGSMETELTTDRSQPTEAPAEADGSSGGDAMNPFSDAE